MRIYAVKTNRSVNIYNECLVNMNAFDGESQLVDRTVQFERLYERTEISGYVSWIGNLRNRFHGSET